MLNVPVGLRAMALATLISCFAGAAPAAAQVAVNINGAAVTIEQIGCNVKFVALPEPTQDKYGTVETRCSATGLVDAPSARRRVAGRVLAIGNGFARWCDQRVVDGQEYRVCSGSRAFKAYMPFVRRGSGPISMSAVTQPRTLSRAEFYGKLRAAEYQRGGPLSFTIGGSGRVASSSGKWLTPLTANLVKADIEVSGLE